MNKILLILVGIAIGTAVPFLCDWVMFGTLAPCRTLPDAQYFNAQGAPQIDYDNITIQECTR